MRNGSGLADDSLGKPRNGLELRVSERSSALQTSSEQLLLELAERERAGRALRQSEWEQSIMTRIAHVFLRAPDDKMYDDVLAIVREALHSRFGVFGYMEENGDLVFPTLSRDVWEKCAVAGKSIVFPPAAWGCSIWGRAIRERKTFRSCGPFHTPEGHIHIDNFLTVPLICGSETIGQVSVANKEGEYAEDDESLLVRIAAYIAPILKARVQRDRQEVARKKAEEALVASEEKYRIFLQHFQGIAFRSTMDFVPVFLHGQVEDVTGYAREDFLDGIRSWDDLVHPEEYAAIAAERAWFAKRPQCLSKREYRIIRKDGQVRWVYEIVQNICDASGVPIAVQGSIYDITERKRMEEEMRRLNEELEQRVKDRTAELETKNKELENMNRLFVGRELRMIELKDKIAKLEGKATVENAEP